MERLTGTTLEWRRMETVGGITGMAESTGTTQEKPATSMAHGITRMGGLHPA